MPDDRDSQLSDKLLFDARESAGFLGIGRTLFLSMHSSGRLGPSPIRLGRRTLWCKNELKTWVSAGCPARARWKKNRN